MDLTLVEVTFHRHICLYPTQWNLNLADLPQYLTISQQKWRGSFAAELFEVSRTICALPWKKWTTKQRAVWFKLTSQAFPPFISVCRTSRKRNFWYGECLLHLGHNSICGFHVPLVLMSSLRMRSLDRWDATLLCLRCRTPPSRSNQIGCKAQGRHSSLDYRAALRIRQIHSNPGKGHRKNTSQMKKDGMRITGMTEWEIQRSKWHGKTKKNARNEKEKTIWKMDHEARLEKVVEHASLWGSHVCRTTRPSL